MEKYEYFTGEDLVHRPSALEKTQFDYSLLGVLADNVKKKTNTNKVNIKKKQDKNLKYNSQHSFTKFKDFDEFIDDHSTLCTKNWMTFFKKNNRFKAVNQQANENKVLKSKVLQNIGDLFNDLYYISNDKYNEEKDGLNTKEKKFLY